MNTKQQRRLEYWEKQKAELDLTPDEITRGDRSVAAGMSFCVLRDRCERVKVREREKAREKDKEWAKKFANKVDTSAFAQHFTTEEKEAIKHWAFNGDRHDINAEGRSAVVSVIERALRNDGLNEIERVSEVHGGKSLYVRVGDLVVRVSDHELPMTPKRKNDRINGLCGRWDREVIVSDWRTISLEDYLNEIRGNVE